MAVQVETESVFSAGKPKVLFEDTYASNPDVNECVLWDIHPDGQRFLMVKPPSRTMGESTMGESTTEAPEPRIQIVLNWFEELKERVPVD